MKDKIIIIGGGGHAKVLISIIKKINNYEIIGYVDFANKGDILGVKYLGDDRVLKDILASDVKNAVIGIGQIKISEHRKNISIKLRSMGFSFPSIISTSSIINEDTYIEEGVQILDRVTINCGAFIGKHTILNTNALIEHDCRIGNFCHIAPSVSISGGVQIGDLSMIGIGATIIQGIKIGSNVLVGAGSVVTKDLLIPGTYVGIPARKVK